MEHKTDITKKTQKIITALYMVSDYIDRNEPIRDSIRREALVLLKDIELGYDSAPNGTHYSDSVGQTVRALIRLIEIAMTVRLISTMNGTILSSELYKLASMVTEFSPENGRLSEDVHGKHLILSPTFFMSDELVGQDQRMSLGQSYGQSAASVNGHTDPVSKRTKITQSVERSDSLKKQTMSPFPEIKKVDRKEKIITLIKDDVSAEGVVIKDISRVFPDLSEKTIQRELIDLVQKGQLLRVGEKRWSRYKYNGQ